MTAATTRVRTQTILDDEIEVVPARRFDVRWLIFVVFVAVVGFTMLRHEMWRDELQAWMIARASHSVPNLLDNIRYEGHPALWYLVLLPLAHLGRGPWVMQIAQLVIASSAFAIVLWRAPFTLLQKALFAGGYFIVFEYGTLSRGYGLGLLFLVATCAIASTRYRWPWSGITLALLALTSAFGCLVAVAVLLGLIVDDVVRRRFASTVDLTADEERRAPRRAASLWSVVVGFAIAIGGLTLAYQQASPPGDAGVYKSWKTTFDGPLMRTSLAAISRALVPMPQLRHEFWNTSIFDGVTALAALLGLAAFFWIAWLLRRRPGACAVWIGSAVFVVGFIYTKIQYASASRYYGHIFLGLVAALWLVPAMGAIGGDDERTARTRSRLFTAILVAQLIAGMFVVAIDWKYPFSNGRNVASYLQRHHLQDAVLIGQPDVSASTVAAYLNRDIYYQSGGRFGTYILWDKQRKTSVAPLTQIVERLDSASNEPVLLVTNKPTGAFGPYRLQELAAFDNGVVRDEHFWLYRVVPKSRKRSSGKRTLRSS
jgi:hypothetical protein